MKIKLSFAIVLICCYVLLLKAQDKSLIQKGNLCVRQAIPCLTVFYYH